MTPSRRGRAPGRFAPAVVALGLLLGACAPATPDGQTHDARATAPAADESPLSPADLAQAQAGTLKGDREAAARLSVHYAADGRDPAARRRWMALAAATGSSRAIQAYVDLLSETSAPADCAEARVVIIRAKSLYRREIAAATARDAREAKMDALETLRAQERRLADRGCRVVMP